MLKLILHFTILISVPLLIACEKEIQYSPNYQIPFLVMNIYLNPDSIWKVSVNQSKPINSQIPNTNVMDATVKVYEQEMLIESLQYNDLNKSYIGTGRPLAGRTYKIIVEKNGFLPIEATSMIEPAPNVLNYSISKDNFTADRLFVTITFSDHLNVKNFYRLVTFNEDEFEELPLWAKNYPNSSGSGWIGKKYFDFGITLRSNDPNLRWDKQSLSAGIFDDVPNNIFNVFDDELIDGKIYSLTFSYSLSQFPEAHNNTVIYFQSISKEFYLYSKSLSAQYYFGDDLLIEPIQVYSNVKNGGGILGSYNSNKIIICVDDYVH